MTLELLSLLGKVLHFTLKLKTCVKFSMILSGINLNILSGITSFVALFERSELRIFQTSPNVMSLKKKLCVALLHINFKWLSDLSGIAPKDFPMLTKTSLKLSDITLSSSIVESSLINFIFL